MALVDYSDSEASDTEQAPSRSDQSKPQTKEGPSSTTSKSGFQKVVDKSNPHRIRVDLPSLSNDKGPAAEEPQDEADRPAKRAKTAGAFGSFNSFLPAPKNTNKPASGTAAGGSLKARPTGLKQGVSLKTGAAPAFSRELPGEPEAEDDWQTEEDFNARAPRTEGLDESEHGHDNTLPDVTEDIKPVGKPVMFKPLSVGRKNPKKKKPPAAQTVNDHPSSSSVANISQEAMATTTATNGEKLAAGVQKPKKSLFSSVEYEAQETSSREANGAYEPLLDDPEGDNGNDQVESPATASSAPPQAQATAQPSDLNALADSLGLTPAQRRQLFGRNAQAKGTEVAHFSVSAEYANNNHMLANEANAAPVHNPVRSIAPGKHSLQQLLNAANSQKEALEESFATGKRNKADAGSKYGW